MKTLTPRDFTISSRHFDEDQDWFGLDANPAGAISVPAADPYRLTEPQNPTSPLRKAFNMSGETTITVIGNLVADPELRFTPSGSAVANFTVASTPRTFDRQSNEWKDGETLFLRASVWREAAENVAESLTKGTRVIVSGRLKSRSYETKEGEKRTVMELEVDEIGPSLRYANVPRGFMKADGSSDGNSSVEDWV
jgi:single-strand DNA-binding protein